MRHEFTPVYERDGDWVIAYCSEVPGANGPGADEGRGEVHDVQAA